MIDDPQDEAIASLAPFASVPPWLAAGMDGERIGRELARRIPDLSDGRLRLIGCTPERLRAKGDEWFARYRVSIADGHDKPSDVILVGKLWAPGQGMPAVDGVPSGRPGDAGWSCWLPDLRLELRVETRDESLPALPTLVEPAAAARLLQPIVRNAGYREATIATCLPEVVRYKPGSRCTVVVRLAYEDEGATPTPPNPIVLKTHQGDQGQVAWSAMTALWDRQAAWSDAVSLAEPLAYLPDARILVQGPVPGERTLKELAREAIGTGSQGLLDELRQELAKTAMALASIHGSGATYGRTATFEQEIAEVRELVSRLALTVPELGMAGDFLIRRLAELSAGEPPDPVVPAHRTFRPAQVLLHKGRIGFVDFDGASMAEPALDLGRFRARLRDIGISAVTRGDGPSGAAAAETLGLLDDLCESFLASYQTHRPVSRTRVLLWEARDLVTGLLHAWTKVRLPRLRPRLTVLVHQLRTSGIVERRLPV